MFIPAILMNGVMATSQAEAANTSHYFFKSNSSSAPAFLQLKVHKEGHHQLEPQNLIIYFPVLWNLKML
jgi:hypothetical protein